MKAVSRVKYYLIGVGRVPRLMMCLVPMLFLVTESSGVPYQGALVIEGKITFGTQMPPDEQFLVELQSDQGISIQTTRSRESGNFRFTNVPGGLFYVLVNIEGFKEHRQLVEVAGRTFVDVVLQEKESTQAGAVGFAGDPDVVDLATLATRYPEEAVDEYEKSLEDAEEGDTERAIERLEQLDAYLEENPDGADREEVENLRPQVLKERGPGIR